MRYIVQPWEAWQTIDTIASRFRVTEDQLVSANPVLQSVPVCPGMILEIPVLKAAGFPSGGYLEYLVQPDDSLYSIANKFKLDLTKVIAQNPQIENPYVIWPGQIVYLVYSE
jgi:LysM repeat protein